MSCDRISDLYDRLCFAICSLALEEFQRTGDIGHMEDAYNRLVDLQNDWEETIGFTGPND